MARQVCQTATWWGKDHWNWPLTSPLTIPALSSCPWSLLPCSTPCQPDFPKTYQALPCFALSKGFNLEFGASLLSAAMLANIIFKLILGPLANKIGPTKTTIYSALVLVFAYGILLTSQHTGLLLVGAFLYGICYFVPPLALPLLTNQFFGKAQANRIYPFISLDWFVRCLFDFGHWLCLWLHSIIWSGYIGLAGGDWLEYCLINLLSKTAEKPR